ncbi:MAG: M61 family metallopeptidase [Gemmataceae bacterium]
MSAVLVRRSVSLLLVLVFASRLLADDAKPIVLTVDATEAPRKLYKAQLTIPASPGSLTLYYPKWIQGEHQPSGPIIDLSGVKMRAAGKPLAWKRDDIDLYAFHVQVPEGADSVEVALEYLIPGDKGGYGAGPAVTAKLAILNWYLVTLYPDGKPVHDIPIRASLTLPPGWQAGCALPIESRQGNVIHYKGASLETLADSPALCGQYFKEIPIGPKDGPPHFLTLACDSAEGLKISDELKGHYEKLVAEVGALFGARHYRSYRFLVALSDQLGHNAIEHHECSDNRMPERMMIDATYRKLAPAWVLAHEYVHSWNGKYRRPEGLATPDFQQPMRTRLLWVYEGLTEYLGFVLAARSGLYAGDVSRANFAQIADWAGNQVGRTWRPLEDTAAAAPHLYSSRAEWSRRRRSVDFYDEGALLWLDADTLIREKSGGTKSLDDFCHAFYGGQNGPPEVRPYSFDDIVAALNGVVEHDWKGFLEKRLTSTDAAPPLDGLTRGGWRLVYKDKPNELLKASDDEEKQIDLSSSIGLLLKDDGKVIDVVPGKAADKAGLGPHMKVVAVNGRRLSAERLREAVAATKGGNAKLTLLLENGDYFEPRELTYSSGERYPHLEHDKSKSDLLGAIFKAKAK